MDRKDFWTGVFLAASHESNCDRATIADDALAEFDRRFAPASPQPAAEETPLPCPVCGNEPEVQEELTTSPDKWDVRCAHPELSPRLLNPVELFDYAPSRAEAIRRWNTRA